MTSESDADADRRVHARTRAGRPPAPVDSGPPGSSVSPETKVRVTRDEQADDDSDAQEPAVAGRGVHDDGQDLLVDDVLVVDAPAGGIAAPGCHEPHCPTAWRPARRFVRFRIRLGGAGTGSGGPR